MKRIGIIFLLILGVFALSACDLIDNTTDPTEETTDPTVETTEPTEETTEETDPTEDTTDPVKPVSYKYQQTKILSIDRVFRQLELLDFGTITYSASTVKMVRYVNGTYQNIIADHLRVGMENVYIRINEETGNVDTILIDGADGFANIRVAIRNSIADISNTATLYHDAVGLRTGGLTTIRTLDNSESISVASGQNVFLSIDAGEIIVRVGSTEQFRTAKRVLVEPNVANTETTFTSISRGVGTPKYKGHLEFNLVNNRILAVNDIDMELYLHRVVPSEMPASFHIEALKAQAVAARTYAYMDILSKTNEKNGYAVDDSVSSQVYNNQSENTTTTSAVNATKGMVMKSGDALVGAFYYSTSAGITASAHEVWIQNSGSLPNPTPYLMGQNLTYDLEGQLVEFDPTNEADMLSFFKQIRLDTPDNNSRFHRWKVELTPTQLRNILNNHLGSMYQSNTQLILTKEGTQFVSRAIPNDVGTVQDMKVTLRGDSGVVIRLEITTSTGVYLIINQYNVRFTLRTVASSAGSTVTTHFAKNTDTTYTQTSTTQSTLPSGFFAIEKSNGNFVLYGGGYGHGVGMSQYGASGLGNKGFNYSQILESYYAEIDLFDVSFDYSGLAMIEEVIENYYLA